MDQVGKRSTYRRHRSPSLYHVAIDICRHNPRFDVNQAAGRKTHVKSICNITKEHSSLIPHNVGKGQEDDYVLLNCNQTAP